MHTLCLPLQGWVGSPEGGWTALMCLLPGSLPPACQDYGDQCNPSSTREPAGCLKAAPPKDWLQLSAVYKDYHTRPSQLFCGAYIIIFVVSISQKEK